LAPLNLFRHLVEKLVEFTAKINKNKFQKKFQFNLSKNVEISPGKIKIKITEQNKQTNTKVAPRVGTRNLVGR
jgi:hypothetical protein